MLLVSAQNQFQGRWNLKVENEPRNRAWWLEVSETPRFVGAPGGDMDSITDLAIRDGELTFSFVRSGQTLRYSARIQGDKLVGSRTGDGSPYQFQGKRAPVITDKDDGSWWPDTPVPLWNGKDLSGWLPLVPGKPLGWQVRDGLLANTAGANNLVSEQKFWNFVLHAEYRIVEGSNSGIGLRGRYEVQILDDFGKPPDSHGHGALYSRIVPSVNASKGPGEWQTLDLRLVGQQLTVVLNGRKIIDRGEAEGLTAMAHDPDEASPGPIVLQGDHKEVEFRGLVITPLYKK